MKMSRAWSVPIGALNAPAIVLFEYFVEVKTNETYSIISS